MIIEKKAKKLDLKSESGFTLMELIIVIGIIGILIAILIPQFNGYTDKANAVAAKAEHKNVLTTVSAYVASLSTSARGWDDIQVVKELGRLFGLTNAQVDFATDETKLNGLLNLKGIVVNLDGINKVVEVTTTKGELKFKSTLNGSTGQSTSFTCDYTSVVTNKPRCEALKTAGLLI